MRVIAGSARGRQLASFSGQAIRPTPDRVREALFSILLSRCGTLAGTRILDLFAGTGALGIEALSRGAAHAWFVDSAALAVKTVHGNLAHCKLAEQASVIFRDVWQALPRLAAESPFQLIFADPPYGQDIAPRLLTELGRMQLLAAGGLLVVETACTDQVPMEVPGLRRLDQRRYGITMIHLFQESVSEVSR